MDAFGSFGFVNPLVFSITFPWPSNKISFFLSLRKKTKNVIFEKKNFQRFSFPIVKIYWKLFIRCLLFDTFVCLSVCCISVYLCIRLFNCLSVCCWSVYLRIRLFNWLSVCCLFVNSSVWLFVCFSIPWSAHLFVEYFFS